MFDALLSACGLMGRKTGRSLMNPIDGILENSDVEFDGADFNAIEVGSNKLDVIWDNDNPDRTVKDEARDESVAVWLANTDWVFTLSA